MSAACILIPCFALAQEDQLLLKHGTYVQEPNECKDPPLAAMMYWDGVGFSGPHSSACTSSVLSHHGKQFSVSTSCTSLGDGTPNPSGQPYVEAFSLARLSSARFVMSKDKQTQSTYRWCSAAAPASPKM